MSSRNSILKAVSEAKPDQKSPLPAVSGQEETSGKPVERFREALEQTSTEVIVANLDAVVQAVSTEAGAGKRVYSGDLEIPGVDRVDVVGREHDLNGTDLFVCSAQLGVAENGAMWLSDRNIVRRSAVFLAEHLILVLDKNLIVDTLHDAYDRIRIDEDGFGIFIAGPSKTADIEQSLVIGAHGPRSLRVYLI